MTLNCPRDGQEKKVLHNLLSLYLPTDESCFTNVFPHRQSRRSKVVGAVLV